MEQQFDRLLGNEVTSETALENSGIITHDAEINLTVAKIKQGGPFPYPGRDGSTFQNREGLLPEKPNGYYREYTVPTPGASDRGARRIVTGGNPPEIFYYTADHYRSFQRIEVD
ncbi:ribonuclease domain-containing protein [Suttonella sp. R2A3]|uniref:ribonuclease domain-containing protein n=1 Tax=Suttonella sp. R2A3 TaxID=2908648 RepID=UPI0038FCE0E8